MKRKKILSLCMAMLCFTLLLGGCGQRTPKSDQNLGTPGEEEDKDKAGGDMQDGDKEGKETEGAGMSAEETARMVMVEGELYVDTGRESDITGRCGVMDGDITSSVERSEIPSQDNQSNFGDGYGYQRVDETGIDVNMDGQWIRFEKETGTTAEDNWGLTLSAENITAAGLTLVCGRSGGSPDGELQTGNPYWLEVQKDGQWMPVETTVPEEEIAWTMEAWTIAKEDRTEWKVDWTWLYGELPDGEYRIGKEIMDFRDTGDYDKSLYYAEFEVTDGANTVS